MGEPGARKKGVCLLGQYLVNPLLMSARASSVERAVAWHSIRHLFYWAHFLLYFQLSYLAIVRFNCWYQHVNTPNEKSYVHVDVSEFMCFVINHLYVGIRTLTGIPVNVLNHFHKQIYTQPTKAPRHDCIFQLSIIVLYYQSAFTQKKRLQPCLPQ